MDVRAFFCMAAVLLLAGCNGNENTTIAPATLPPDTPNSFLTYPNTQASLAAGDYEIVAATTVAGQSGSYRITLTRDDGSTQLLSGSWSGSGGQSTTSPANPHHALTLTHAGGLRLEMTATGLASGSAYLYLLRNSEVVAHSASGATQPLIDLPTSRISSADYGAAYYAAVDPTGVRTTLDDWKQKNGFSLGADTHVIFRDAKDLGYGRDMYARHNSDGSIAIFVRNFVVALQPGSSSNYGPLNVEAAISGDTRYLQGTNAIEFSYADEDNPSDPNGHMLITKFFTFDKNGKRVTSGDLDGRGVKHVPGACWTCHGGQTLPLDESGKFQAQSLRSAKLNLVDAAVLEYSPDNGYQRPQLEAGLRLINKYVHESFAAMKVRPATTQGHWYADFATSLAEGRYGGVTMSAGSSDDSYVPPGWREDLSFPSRPVGVEQLYKKVVEPHCIGCHALQGSTVGEGITEVVDGQNVSLANAINFSSYEKFMSYRSRISDYVYKRGIMPLSLRNFESFWKDPAGAPSLLASFLADPTLYDAHGNVIQPGLPVARPGDNRSAKSPVQLDGNASSFAGSYQWQVTSAPLGAVVSLSGSTSARPVLTASADGDYVIALTVTNSKGTSTANVTITVDSTLAKSQGQLTFVNDIMPILGSATNSNCTVCHRSGGGYNGIPVYWTSANDSDGVNRLYQRVLARVDLADPENSKLLRKPTSHTHGGSVQIDPSVPADQAKYSTLLNWIREGAVCGSDATLCP